jgi:multicomponent Na+:H+ antiporter subunit G
MIKYIAYTLVSGGVLFNLVAVIALLRFPDVYTRLSCSTKCITIGVSLILIGVLVMHGWSAAGIKAVICLLFFLITSPVEAHVISKAAHAAGSKLSASTTVDAYAEDKNSNELS